MNKRQRRHSEENERGEEQQTTGLKRIKKYVGEVGEAFWKLLKGESDSPSNAGQQQQHPGGAFGYNPYSAASSNIPDYRFNYSRDTLPSSSFGVFGQHQQLSGPHQYGARYNASNEGLYVDSSSGATGYFGGAYNGAYCSNIPSGGGPNAAASRGSSSRRPELFVPDERTNENRYKKQPKRTAAARTTEEDAEQSNLEMVPNDAILGFQEDGRPIFAGDARAVFEKQDIKFRQHQLQQRKPMTSKERERGTFLYPQFAGVKDMRLAGVHEQNAYAARDLAVWRSNPFLQPKEVNLFRPDWQQEYAAPKSCLRELLSKEEREKNLKNKEHWMNYRSTAVKGPHDPRLNRLHFPQHFVMQHYHPVQPLFSEAYKNRDRRQPWPVGSQHLFHPFGAPSSHPFAHAVAPPQAIEDRRRSSGGASSSNFMSPDYELESPDQEGNSSLEIGAANNYRGGQHQPSAKYRKVVQQEGRKSDEKMKENNTSTLSSKILNPASSPKGRAGSSSRRGGKLHRDEQESTARVPSEPKRITFGANKRKINSSRYGKLTKQDVLNSLWEQDNETSLDGGIADSHDVQLDPEKKKKDEELRTLYGITEKKELVSKKSMLPPMGPPIKKHSFASKDGGAVGSAGAKAGKDSIFGAAAPEKIKDGASTGGDTATTVVKDFKQMQHRINPPTGREKKSVGRWPILDTTTTPKDVDAKEDHEVKKSPIFGSSKVDQKPKTSITNIFGADVVSKAEEEDANKKAKTTTGADSKDQPEGNEKKPGAAGMTNASSNSIFGSASAFSLSASKPASNPFLAKFKEQNKDSSANMFASGAAGDHAAKEQKTEISAAENSSSGENKTQPAPGGIFGSGEGLSKSKSIFGGGAATGAQKEGDPATSANSTTGNSIFGSSTDKAAGIFGSGGGGAPAAEQPKAGSIFGGAPGGAATASSGEMTSKAGGAAASIFGGAAPAAEPSKGGSIFGGPAAAPDGSKSSIFGAPAPAADQQAKAGSSSNIFGAPAADSKASSIFGGTAAPAEAKPTGGIFGSTSGPEAKTGSSIFGAAAPASENAAKPAAASNTTSLFGAPADAKQASIFGSAPATAPAGTEAKASSIFGGGLAPAQPPAESKASSIFGGGLQTDSKQTTGSIFGAAAAAAAPAATSQDSKQSIFGGGGAPASATATPAFGAASSAGAAPAAAGGGIFGSGAPASTSAGNSIFGGGANTTSQPTSSAGGIFGAAGAATSTGAGSNASIFGGGAAAPASTTTAAATSGSSIFGGVGGAAPAAATSTGGIFGATAAAPGPFGGTTTTSAGGAFGGGATTGAAPATNVFGAPAQPNNNSSGIFGSANTNNPAGGGGGVFGGAFGGGNAAGNNAA
ncbi:unnamed protein product, partial [Amoebophrya sp. A120]|eukprot:GSA120T00009398001.1